MLLPAKKAWARGSPVIVFIKLRLTKSNVVVLSWGVPSTSGLLSNNKLQISTITNNLVKHKIRHYATKYLFFFQFTEITYWVRQSLGVFHGSILCVRHMFANNVAIVTVTITFHLYSWVEAEKIEHVLHVNEGLSDVTINRPKKIQGQGQLKKKTIHHHQVSNCHRACKKNSKII